MKDDKTGYPGWNRKYDGLGWGGTNPTSPRFANSQLIETRVAKQVSRTYDKICPR